MRTVPIPGPPAPGCSPAITRAPADLCARCARASGAQRQCRQTQGRRSRAVPLGAAVPRSVAVSWSARCGRSRSVAVSGVRSVGRRPSGRLAVPRRLGACSARGSGAHRLACPHGNPGGTYRRHRTDRTGQEQCADRCAAGRRRRRHRVGAAEGQCRRAVRLQERGQRDLPAGQQRRRDRHCGRRDDDGQPGSDAGRTDRSG